jgi:outer membrane receptor protein involved in Fe transport
MRKTIVAAALGATALTAIGPTGVSAQSAQTARITRHFDIPAGPLIEALQAWSKITKREIVYRMEDVGGKQTSGLRGNYSPTLALQGLLLGTGLKLVTTEDGAVAIRPLSGEEINTSATPDILVKGRLNWTLNTGIERTQDDSAPFIVMSRKEIEQSGAPNLEAFIRNQLNVNASPNVSDQPIGQGKNPGDAVGLSNINLRGIGAADTLILIDGRRQPGVNLGEDGGLGQSSIAGIPISAVERIEVLASSASGIYGNGASGGVINIVMRRDFKGGELGLNYNNTGDFKAGRGSIDLSAGLPLEGGRTRISFNGNWTKGQALRYGDRENLRQRGLDAILANSPKDFFGSFAAPPQGTMVNFNAFNGRPLQLKQEYGGQKLSNSYGTVPVGYAGLKASGVDALVQSLGKYNMGQPNTASGYGARAAMIYPINDYSGSLAVNREFDSAVSAYANVSYRHTEAVNVSANMPSTFILDASAPNNPFTSDLTVTLPGDPSHDIAVKTSTSYFSAFAGTIVRLPYDWQAVAELSYSRFVVKQGDSPPFITDPTKTGLESGSIDALRDLSSAPLNLAYNVGPYYTRRGDGISSTISPSLRFAGPLPITLPGGKVQMTLNTQIDRDRSNPALSTTLSPSSFDPTAAALTIYKPVGIRTTKSAYAEAVFPLVGGAHRLPLIRLLELRLSARYDSSVSNGADPYACSSAYVEGQYDYFTGCPPQGAEIHRGIGRGSNLNPMYSMRWQPTGGITFRASFATGYRPPRLDQLVRLPADQLFVRMKDTARGGEYIYTNPDGTTNGFKGGNPNAKPETSRTLTAGVILEPHFIDGLRFSADWTRIHKEDIYYSPVNLVTPFLGGSQAVFDDFLKMFPDRITRAAPSDGKAVGKITSIDLSLLNLQRLQTEAIDFTLNYDTSLFGGNLALLGRATYVRYLKLKAFEITPTVDYAGVVSRIFASATGGSGTLRFRGSASAQWSKGDISLGWQTRFMDSYYLLDTREVVPQQGSAKVASQMYHDFNLSYKAPSKMTVRLGINNIFNKIPPLDAAAYPLYYSGFGDPRLRNFYLAVIKAF